MAPTKSTQSMLVASKGVTKSIVSLSRRAISTRTQHQKVHIDGLQNIAPSAGKRKADVSPVRNEKGVKRSALGNVTNAVLNALEDSKKLTRSKSEKKTTNVTNQSNAKLTENHAIFVEPNAVQRQHKVVTRSSARVNESSRANVNDATNGLKKVNISTTVVKGKKKTESITANNNNVKPNTKAANVNVDCQMASCDSDSEINQLKAETKANARRLSSEFDLLDSEDSSHYMSALEDL